MLREVDEVGGIDTAYSRLPSCDGVGMALYNRLIRAAGYEVIDLEKYKILGLTGQTGAGKSTVSKVLQKRHSGNKCR